MAECEIDRTPGWPSKGRGIVAKMRRADRRRPTPSLGRRASSTLRDEESGGGDHPDDGTIFLGRSVRIRDDGDGARRGGGLRLPVAGPDPLDLRGSRLDLGPGGNLGGRSFLSWPIGRAISSAFDPGGRPVGPDLPEVPGVASSGRWSGRGRAVPAGRRATGAPPAGRPSGPSSRRSPGNGEENRSQREIGRSTASGIRSDLPDALGVGRRSRFLDDEARRPSAGVIA